jgi:hypothetical protein
MDSTQGNGKRLKFVQPEEYVCVKDQQGALGTSVPSNWRKSPRTRVPGGSILTRSADELLRHQLEVQSQVGQGLSSCEVESTYLIPPSHRRSLQVIHPFIRLETDLAHRGSKPCIHES